MMKIETENKLDILRVDEIATDLELSPRSVRRLCESGELPATKVGGNWIILATEYRQYVEALKDEAIEGFLISLAKKNKLNIHFGGSGQNG
jgi:excisionase family DNA binding protein